MWDLNSLPMLSFSGRWKCSMKTWTALRLLFSFANKAKFTWKQKVRSSTEADLVWHERSYFQWPWECPSCPVFKVSIIFLFWSVFCSGFFSDVPISVTLCLWIVFGVWKVCTVFPLEALRKWFSNTMWLWRSEAFLCSALILMWWLPGAYVLSRPVCVQQEYLSSWLLMERSSSFSVCGRVLHSTPWPPMFQGQKSSKILICRCVAVPSADFWGAGLVLTCVSPANCLLIQSETLQFWIH